MSEGRWGIILGGWGWLGMIGGEWVWVHCLIMPSSVLCSSVLSSNVLSSMS